VIEAQCSWSWRLTITLHIKQIRAYRCWALSGDWVSLTLCPCLFRGVLRLGGTPGLPPVTSCDVQIRALVQILPGGREVPAQGGFRALRWAG